MTPRTFTGRHMWLVMLAFFGTVVGVNLVMARYASSTFGGTVVDNSYVASQNFNRWLQESRAQAQLGWQTRLALDADRHPVLVVSSGGGPAPGFSATGTAHHPLGRAPDVPLAFFAHPDGSLVGDRALPAGRWLVRIAITRDGKVLRLAQTLR